MPNDGYAYHNVAVNIVKGNGYSIQNEKPYNPYFFREPGYPFILATTYKVWSLIGGNVDYYVEGDKQSNHSEILFVKYVQALLSAFCVILLLLTFRFIVKPKFAFIVALLYALYIPFAVYSTQILRETLQTFLLLLLNYFFIKLLITDKLKWLLLFSLMVVLSNYTFQTSLIIPLYFFIYFGVYTKRFIKTFKYSALLSVIVLLFAIPWIIRAYNFYPDIRVAKSMGVGITTEQMDFANTSRYVKRCGVMSSKELYNLHHKEWYGISEYERFDRSFSGYYEHKADSLRSLVSSKEYYTQVFVDMFINNFRESVLHSAWFYSKNGLFSIMPYQFYFMNGNIIMIILSIPVIIFGLLGFYAIFIFYRRLSLISFLFVFLFSLYPIIGDDPRRMLPVHGFSFLFSTISIYYIYMRFLKKISKPEIIKRIF